MRLIAHIEGEDIWERAYDRTVVYNAKGAIDGDGSPTNSYNDPYWQPDTSLHLNGKPINAESVAYVVVPPAILTGVRRVVLGCKAVVVNLQTLAYVNAVVADIGPHKKLGEISIACAKSLGIPHSPVSGGMNEHALEYTLWPGVPAQVKGVKYRLQPYRG